MKFLLTTILSAALAFALGTFMPWWSVAIAGFIAGLAILQRPWIAALAAFTGVFIVWFCLAYFISSANGHALATNIATMVLKSPNAMMLIFVSALLGGIVASLAGASGAWFRKAFELRNN